jgi:hypothetical protein
VMVHSVDVQSRDGTRSLVVLLTVSWDILVVITKSTDLVVDLVAAIAVLGGLIHPPILASLISMAKSIL